MSMQNLFPKGDFPNYERSAFLQLIIEISQDNQAFKYLEIGSYLGGSISPLLQVETCTEVISIDKRGRNQPDERGREYDYTSVTENQMLENLRSSGFSTEKIHCFDGSIEDYQFMESDSFRIALIDGEHTDFACFRDFSYLRPHLDKDSVVIFDDSNLVIKAIKNAITLLKSEEIPHTVFRLQNTRFVVMVFGSFDNANFLTELRDENLDEYFQKCEQELFWVNVRHRVGIQQFLKQWLIKRPFIASLYSLVNNNRASSSHRTFNNKTELPSS